MARRKHTSKRKIKVKNKFKKAIVHLSKMKSHKRKGIINRASNEFIRDFSSVLRQLRKKPHLVSPAKQRLLRPHKHKLRLLAHVKTPVHRKRHILNQKGGFVISSILVPLIAAAITSAGGIGASAVHAAVSRR